MFIEGLVDKTQRIYPHVTILKNDQIGAYKIPSILFLKVSFSLKHTL